MITWKCPCGVGLSLSDDSMTLDEFKETYKIHVENCDREKDSYRPKYKFGLLKPE